MKIKAQLAPPAVVWCSTRRRPLLRVQLVDHVGVL
jgi:hypothetical protein